MWSLDIENAFLQAYPFPREVYLHAPPELCPMNPNRAWKLNAPAYGLNDAPVEFHKSLKRYLLKSGTSLKLVGLRYTSPPWTPASIWFTIVRRRRRVSSPRTLMIVWAAGLWGYWNALDISWNKDLALSKSRRMLLRTWVWSWRRKRIFRLNSHRRSSRVN